MKLLFVEILIIVIGVIGVALIYISAFKMSRKKSEKENEKWVFVGLLGMPMILPAVLYKQILTAIEILIS